jgi:ParB-like chromosome segregation protein Spo0J
VLISKGGPIVQAELKIAYLKADAIKPFARNSRTHSESQIAQIAASMKAFGWTNPILIDEDKGVIAGHGRLLAAATLGLEQVPTITLAGLTKAQRRALVIADNQLAMNAGWNLAMLGEEMRWLSADGFEMDLLGFDPAALVSLMIDPLAALTDPDDIPEVPTVATSQLGDVWVLGNHRLVCGDSTDPVAVAMPRRRQAALDGHRPAVWG